MTYLSWSLDGYDEWKTEPDLDPREANDDEPDDFDERRWRDETD